jgi:hypothetical protein
MIEPNDVLRFSASDLDKDNQSGNNSAKNGATAVITIRSLSPIPLIFKVKTNKPNNYLVKPNQGVLLKDKPVQVEVKTQFLFDSETGKEAEISDKFLI